MEPNAPAHKRCLRIVTIGHSAAVLDEDAGVALPIIHSTLTEDAHRFSAGGPHGVRCERFRRQHYRKFDDGLVFSAGHLPRVRRELSEKGFATDVEHKGCWRALDQVRKASDDSDSATTVFQHNFVAAVSKRPRGQIVLPRPSETGPRIGLMADDLHDCAIFVVAKNEIQAEKISDGMRTVCRRPVTRDSGEMKRQRFPIFVGTPVLFEVVPLESWDVVIVADVESALSVRVRRPLAKQWQSVETVLEWPTTDLTLNYAFVDPHHPLSSSERFQLEEIFGDVVYVEERESDHNPVEVRVDFLAFDSPIQLLKLDGLSRKRELFWRNHVWNKRIALLAREIAKIGRRKRDKRGSDTGTAIRQLPNVVGKASVCVLVESTEHARELQKLLRGWSIVDLNSETSCIPAAGHREIATFASAAEWGIQADVIIRADGSPEWPLGEAFACRTLGSTNTVRVVDFDDVRDAQARKETASRMAAYQRFGWPMAAHSDARSKPIEETAVKS